MIKTTWKHLKKQGLMDVVVEVVSKQGLDGFTMDSVARSAGVAKGTLYAYFKNKQDLLKEAIETTIIPIVEELKTILSSHLPADEKLKKMIHRHLEYFELHRNFFRIFIHDHFTANQRTRRFRSCIYQDLLNATAKALDDGVRSGIFRSIDSSKVAAMLVEADIAVIRQRLVSTTTTVDADAKLISDIFLHGIQRKS